MEARILWAIEVKTRGKGSLDNIIQDGVEIEDLEFCELWEIICDF